MRAAFETWESLVKEFPAEFDYRYGLADAYTRQGIQLMWWGGQVEKAEAALPPGRGSPLGPPEGTPRRCPASPLPAGDPGEPGRDPGLDATVGRGRSYGSSGPGPRRGPGGRIPRSSLEYQSTSWQSAWATWPETCPSRVETAKPRSFIRRSLAIREGLAERYPEMLEYGSGFRQALERSGLRTRRIEKKPEEARELVRAGRPQREGVREGPSRETQPPGRPRQGLPRLGESTCARSATMPRVPARSRRAEPPWMRPRDAQSDPSLEPFRQRYRGPPCWRKP